MVLATDFQLVVLSLNLLIAKPACLVSLELEKLCDLISVSFQLTTVMSDSDVGLMTLARPALVRSFLDLVLLSTQLGDSQRLVAHMILHLTESWELIMALEGPEGCALKLASVLETSCVCIKVLLVLCDHLQALALFSFFALTFFALSSFSLVNTTSLHISLTTLPIGLHPLAMSYTISFNSFPVFFFKPFWLLNSEDQVLLVLLAHLSSNDDDFIDLFSLTEAAAKWERRSFVVRACTRVRYS